MRWVRVERAGCPTGRASGLFHPDHNRIVPATPSFHCAAGGCLVAWIVAFHPYQGVYLNPNKDNPQSAATTSPAHASGR